MSTPTDSPLPSWDAIQVLALVNPSTRSWTCVGHAHSSGRRCRNKIAKPNVELANQICRDLPRAVREQSQDEVIALLRELAKISVCKSQPSHQRQAEETAARWSGMLPAQGRHVSISSSANVGTSSGVTRQASSTSGSSRESTYPSPLATPTLNSISPAMPLELNSERGGPTDTVRHPVQSQHGQSMSNGLGPTEDMVRYSAEFAANIAAVNALIIETVASQALIASDIRTTQLLLREIGNDMNRLLDQQRDGRATDHSGRAPSVPVPRIDEAQTVPRPTDATLTWLSSSLNLDDLNNAPSARSDASSSTSSWDQLSATLDSESDEEESHEDEGALEGDESPDSDPISEAGEGQEDYENPEHDQGQEDEAPVRHVQHANDNESWARYRRDWSAFSRFRVVRFHEPILDTIPWPVESGCWQDVSTRAVNAFFLKAPLEGLQVAGTRSRLGAMLELEAAMWDPTRLQQKFPDIVDSAEAVRLVNLVDETLEDMGNLARRVAEM